MQGYEEEGTVYGQDRKERGECTCCLGFRSCSLQRNRKQIVPFAGLKLYETDLLQSCNNCPTPWSMILLEKRSPSAVQ